MKNDIDFSKLETRQKVWLKRIWGIAPFIFLCIVILVLILLVKSKNDFIKTMKKDAGILEGMKIAAEKADETAGIFHDSKNPKAATKKLMKAYGLSKRQAQAVVQMPLASLTKVELKAFDKDLNTIRKNIAANKNRQAAARPDENVVTMALLPRTIHNRLNLPGTIEPWVELDVLAEVSGKVIKKVVKEGDAVNIGDVIIIIDSRKYKNNYRSAKALYESALASRKRLSELHKEALSTTSQLDNAVAQAENYKAAMDNAKQDLENCTVRSLISGTVNRIFIEEGQYLNKSASIAQILQMDQVKVMVGIPESDVDAVNKLTHFDVKIDALGGKVFTGAKRYLSKSADTQARLYNLEIGIDNTEGSIFPDMFARVDIVKNVVNDTIIVPLYSLISYKNGHIVYVEKEGTAHLKNVETGFVEGWQIEITKGLEPGEQLIVVGHRSISDGQKVHVTRTVKEMKELAQ